MLFPLSVKHFVHPEGFVLHLLTFLCRYRGGEVELSREHTEFEWVDIDGLLRKLSNFYLEDKTVLMAWFGEKLSLSSFENSTI